MTAKTSDKAYDHHRGTAPLLRPGKAIRTRVFLAINLAGFAVVNAFWQYLASGRWVNPSLRAWYDDLRTPLGEIFIRPLNIFTHPWMVLVSGLLLAVVIFVPIIVAVLHRLIVAGIFVAVVMLLGHTMVLGVAIAIGCLLAARTPLRSDMPFLASVLGLSPVALYLYLFGLAGVDTAVSQPLQRWVLRVPFLIAIVSAILAAAAVLGLARLMRFRPGVVWPVLAVLLAAPLTIFYVKIGSDELDYCLIEAYADSPDPGRRAPALETRPEEFRLAPGDAVFKADSLDKWGAQHRPGLSRDALPLAVEDHLRDKRDKLIEVCRRFCARHPRSDRLPAVLWVKAQCLSLQCDADELRSGQIKYMADYPLPSSEAVWCELSSRFKGAPQAALADWRLAELELRQAFGPGVDPNDSRRLVRDVHERLAAVERRLAGLPETSPDRREVEPSTGVFSEAQSVPSGSYYAAALFAVRRLRWVMEENRAMEDANSAEALSALLGVNPHQSGYLDRLHGLLSEDGGRRAHTRMRDYLILEIAQATPDRRERAAMLWGLADGLTGAAIEANYELGILLRQEPAFQSDPKYKTPEEYFRTVRDARESPWTHPAQEMLARLAATSKPKEKP